MDTLQDFLTLTATVIEYFFFAYLAVAFMVYSLKSPNIVKQVRATSTAQTGWQRSVEPNPSLMGMAG